MPKSTSRVFISHQFRWKSRNNRNCSSLRPRKSTSKISIRASIFDRFLSPFLPHFPVLIFHFVALKTQVLFFFNVLKLNRTLFSKKETFKKIHRKKREVDFFFVIYNVTLTVYSHHLACFVINFFAITSNLENLLHCFIELISINSLSSFFEFRSTKKL